MGVVEGEPQELGTTWQSQTGKECTSHGLKILQNSVWLEYRLLT